MIFSLNGIESASDAMISAWGYGNEGKNCHVSVRAGRFVNPLGPPTGLLDVHRDVGNALTALSRSRELFLRRTDEKLQSRTPGIL
jgi:hypothetical protein